MPKFTPCICTDCALYKNNGCNLIHCTHYEGTKTDFFTPKIIDLNKLVNSGVDMEFTDMVLFSGLIIGKLTKIVNTRNLPYKINNIVNYKRCRIKLDHWNIWLGGDCPLPEGLNVKVLCRTSTNPSQEFNLPDNYATTVNTWKHLNNRNDIIAFKIIGLKDGYKYPWDSNNEVNKKTT